MTSDKHRIDPLRKDDDELGIDRSLIDPIKFVSTIDSKPINPPYLRLADLDSYIKSEAGQSAMGDKKKEPSSAEKTGAAAKEDLSATMTSKKTAADGSNQDYKAAHAEFEVAIEDQYNLAAVELMNNFEKRRKEEEHEAVNKQLHELRKMNTKKHGEKGGEKGEKDSFKDKSGHTSAQ